MADVQQRPATPIGRLILISLCILLSWPVSDTNASLYVCWDRQGRKQITNTPASSNCTAFKPRRKPTLRTQVYDAVATGANKQPSINTTRYDSQITHFGTRYMVDPDLIKAVIRAESGFDRYAVSGKGAQGLMQLMPETAREMNVSDPFNPGQNIAGGVRYLRYLLDAFNGNISLVLAAYNAGPTLIRKIGRIPEFPETQKYVAKVLALYRSYKNSHAIEDFFPDSSLHVRDIITVQ